MTTQRWFDLMDKISSIEREDDIYGAKMDICEVLREILIDLRPDKN